MAENFRQEFAEAFAEKCAGNFPKTCQVPKKNKNKNLTRIHSAEPRDPRTISERALSALFCATFRAKSQKPAFHNFHVFFGRAVLGSSRAPCYQRDLC